MKKHDPFNDQSNGNRADAVSRDHGVAGHESQALSTLPAEILELLQRQAEALLRTHRESRGSSNSTADAPIVDPWALAGGHAGATDGGSAGNANMTMTLQKLLAIGGKLLAKLESSTKNPFDFLP